MTSLIVETPRLSLQPLALDDVDVALEMFTDPDVTRYVGDLMSADEIREEFPVWMRRCAGGTIGIWCIHDRESGDKHGTGALLPLPVDADDTEWDLMDGGDIPDREIEVGYILKRKAWGRGIATEVCRALTDFAFERTPLDEIVACTDIGNLASQHVLQKCGMRATGPRRAYAEDDVPGFSLSRRQWLNRRQ